MSRAYIELSDGGQLHYHRWCADGDDRPVLLCSPPVPYGGRYFVNLAEALQPDVDVIAADPPGFGASDPLAGVLTIERQAEALLELTASLGVENANWLGFHSGALVTLEVAVQAPRQVEHLLMIDVPALPPEIRRDMLNKTEATRCFTRELSSIEPLWQFNVARHGDDISPERALEYLIQDLQAGALQPQGFRAAFSYDLEAAVARLPEVAIKLIATRSALLEATRNLQQLFARRNHPAFDYQEWLDVERLVFDLNAARVASMTRSALSLESWRQLATASFSSSPEMPR